MSWSAQAILCSLRLTAPQSASWLAGGAAAPHEGSPYAASSCHGVVRLEPVEPAAMGSASYTRDSAKHAHLAAVAPIIPVSRPSFCRISPGMRSIHPHKCHNIKLPVRRCGCNVEVTVLFVLVTKPVCFYTSASHSQPQNRTLTPLAGSRCSIFGVVKPYGRARPR